MRNYFGHILSGLVGGAFCFGLIHFTQPQGIVSEVSPSSKLVSDLAVLPTSVPGSSDFITAAAKGTPAVVHIHCEESPDQARNRSRRNPSFGFENFFGGGDFFGMDHYREQSGTGSGVIYSQDGYIITNNHVVGFGDIITVTTHDGKKYKATKIGTDKSTDLAVIKIEGSGLPTLKLANSEDVKVGEWVLAVGNPFDLNSTVTAGIVSAKGRELGIIKDQINQKAIEDFIQTDAAVNPGNSGGALINLAGDLIGINTAIATPTGTYAGYSFAIPTKIVKSRVTAIIESGSDYEKVNLGIGGYDVDPELKKEFDLSVDAGFYIDEVVVASPAKYAGILPGDVIIGINNATIKNYTDIENALKFIKQGDTVNIKVSRDDKQMEIPAKLRKGF